MLYSFIRLFTVAVIAVCSIHSYSKDMEIGFMAGPTVTKHFTNFGIKYNPDVRYAAEFMFQYRFTNIIGLRTGLGYENKGARINYVSLVDQSGNDISNGKVQFHQHYLTLPVLAEFTFGKKVQPFVNAGIYLGVLLNSKTVFRYGDNKTSDNITNDKQRIDVGVMASAGIKVPVKKSCFFVFEIRNNIGLLNVYKNNFPGSERYKTRNYSTSFNVGFSYRFSKNEADSK